MLKKIITRSRFFIFSAIMVIVTLAICLVSTVISLLTFWRDSPLTLNSLFISCFNLSCRSILGISFRIIGKHNLPADGNVFFACKHQSLWETIALIPVLSLNVYVGKKILTLIPIWGWSLYSSGNYIPLNRGKATASTFALLRHLRRRFSSKKNVRMIIFPEGRRSLPNETPVYRGGLDLLYRIFAVQVVPLALNSGYLWPKQGYLKGGTITVSILPPIAPGLGKNKLMPLLQDRIEKETKAIGAP